MQVWSRNNHSEEKLKASMLSLFDSIYHRYGFNGVSSDVMRFACMGYKESMDEVIKKVIFPFEGVNCKILVLNEKIYFVEETDEVFHILKDIV